MKYFTKEYIKKMDKVRVIHLPSPELKLLDTQVYNTILQHIKLRKDNRIHQSLQDIEALKKYKHVRYLDVKSALMSGNVLLLCLLMVLISPLTIKLVPKLLKIYFCPVVAKNGSILHGRSNKLRIGLKTSQLMLALGFHLPMKLFPGYMNVYVDDVILASNSAFINKVWTFLLKSFFFLLGFRFHKEVSINNDQKAKLKASGRLGIEFTFVKGELLTTIRHKTLKKYLGRIKKIAMYGQSDWSERVIGEILYVKKDTEVSFPLYWSFGPIWNCPVQRKIFVSRFTQILKHYWPEYRTLTKEEIVHRLRGANLDF